MYQTMIKGDRLYHTVSEGYGEAVELFGFTEEGETPMSLVNLALASCVTMCVQGYFARKEGLKELEVTTMAGFEDEVFSIQIALPTSLSEQKEAELLAYVDQFCRVKKLLRDDLVIRITLAK